MPTILSRDLYLIPVAALAAAVFGALFAFSPAMAVALIGGVGITVAAFAFPVTHFAMLLVATIIVPYELQNQAGIGGGTGAAGLVASDVLLLTGLARATYALASTRVPFSRSELVGMALVLTWLTVVVLQFLHGAFLEGAGVSQPGDEMRSLNGLAAFFIALPLLRDPESRRRLYKALLVVGFLLGLWGLLQWLLQLGFSGGAGVRQGVALTNSGRGQLQGGLYGFPVAVALSFAALLSGEIKAVGTRLLVMATLALNGICVVLTFERTFLLVSLLAMGIIALRSGRAQRARAVIMAPIAIVMIFIPLAAVAPDTLTTLRERMMSIGQYGTDPSVRYRVIESEHVLQEIRAHPVGGSGLGAVIWWGRPANQVPPSAEVFAHNGYLVIAWKLGIPAAVFLFGGLLVAIFRRGRARGEPMLGLLSIAAQAALLALFITNVTFPSVIARPITPTMGMLLALCALPRVRVRT